MATLALEELWPGFQSPNWTPLVQRWIPYDFFKYRTYL